MTIDLLSLGGIYLRLAFFRLYCYSHSIRVKYWFLHVTREIHFLQSIVLFGHIFFLILIFFSHKIVCVCANVRGFSVELRRFITVLNFFFWYIPFEPIDGCNFVIFPIPNQAFFSTIQLNWIHKSACACSMCVWPIFNGKSVKSTWIHRILCFFFVADQSISLWAIEWWSWIRLRVEYGLFLFYSRLDIHRYQLRWPVELSCTPSIGLPRERYRYSFAPRREWIDWFNKKKMNFPRLGGAKQSNRVQSACIEINCCRAIVEWESMLHFIFFFNK